jgi:mRNA-degrading endonuclease RelE of RelBE toxin-antitoxin system
LDFAITYRRFNLVVDIFRKSGYILARMRYEIILAPEAEDDLKHLAARDRSTIREAIKTHLRYEPKKVSKSRIKRLRGISRPEYRLSVGDFRIFYDVKESEVEVLAIVPKPRASEWLERYGEQE